MTVVRGFLAMFLCMCSMVAVADREPQAPSAASLHLPGIQVLHVLDTHLGRVYFASQPAASSWPRLKSLGVKKVLNLRAPEELAFNEARQVRQAGLQYQNLQVKPDQLNRKTLQSFQEILAQPKNYPLFIHCKSANRVALMWALQQVASCQQTLSQAMLAAQQLGLTHPSLVKLLQTFSQQQGLGRTCDFQ